MGLFTPVKKHPNRFNYIPRYYDPVKEAREQRRRELRGERGEDIDMAVAQGEYKPGDYLRRRKAMRIERKSADSAERGGKRNPIITLAFVAVIVLLLGYLLVPRIVALINGAQNSQSATEQSIGNQNGAAKAEEAEFDPYAPIVIVPNDYQE